MVLRELKASGYNVSPIYAGHAFAAIAEAIQHGVQIETIVKTGGTESSGLLSPQDLYRDEIHAGSIGKYVAALAAYASIYRTAPVNIDHQKQALFAGEQNAIALSPAGARIVEKIVWNSFLYNDYLQTLL